MVTYVCPSPTVSVLPSLLSHVHLHDVIPLFRCGIVLECTWASIYIFSLSEPTLKRCIRKLGHEMIHIWSVGGVVHVLNLDSLTLTFKSSHFAPGAPPTNEVADTAIKCVLAYARVLVTCITTHVHTQSLPPGCAILPENQNVTSCGF